MTHTLAIAGNETRDLKRKTLAAALVPVALLCQIAAAQDNAPQGGAPQALEVKVSDASSAGRLVNVAVNKSVVVDFNVPVRDVRVVNGDIATVEPIAPGKLIVTGKTFGVTQMVVWTEDGDMQHVFDLAVDLELDRLKASIRSTEPRARVNATSVMDSVVLTGTAPDAESAERIMQIAELYSVKVTNQMRVAGAQQVLLRVTVAEVNRTSIRQLGFNGWVAGDNFRDAFGLSNLNGINPTNIGAAANANVTGRIPFVTDTAGIPVTGSSTLSFGFPRGQMQFFVQALRENGLLRVLAEPNLVTLNGQPATFLAGGEVPIPIVTNDRIKIDYKRFGVQLNFTPTVVSEDRIRLYVVPEISEPDFSNAVTVSGTSVPSFTTRRVETVVELGSGQTIAIGEVPVLGALFSSDEFRTEQTELVVLVTPELAESLSSDQVTYVPGAELLAPNDFEFYLLGKLEGQKDDDRPTLRPRVQNEWPVRPGYGDGQLGMMLRGPLGPAGYEEGA
jgi:pilus assembly protein CpaC